MMQPPSGLTEINGSITQGTPLFLMRMEINLAVGLAGVEDRGSGDLQERAGNPGLE